MKPYSQDLRRRIVRARERGDSAQEVAKRFDLSKRSVERYWSCYQQSGQVSVKKIGGYRRSRLQGYEKQLNLWIKQQGDLTLVEIQQRCRKCLGVSIGINALWHQVNRLGLSYKKNSARRRARS